MSNCDSFAAFAAVLQPINPILQHFLMEAKLVQRPQLVLTHGCSAYEIGVRLAIEGLGCTWKFLLSMPAIGN